MTDATHTQLRPLTDTSPSAIVAGFIAMMTGYTSSLVLMFQAGQAAGLEFRWDLVGKSPNTTLAHQLIFISPEESRAELSTAIYDAYFRRGKDITDLDTLVELAGAAGLDQPSRVHSLGTDEPSDPCAISISCCSPIGRSPSRSIGSTSMPKRASCSPASRAIRRHCTRPSALVGWLPRNTFSATVRSGATESS